MLNRWLPRLRRSALDTAYTEKRNPAAIKTLKAAEADNMPLAVDASRGANGLAVPHNADWAWRPEPWHRRLQLPSLSSVPTQSTFGQEVKVFHDSRRSDVAMLQTKNQRQEDLTPFGVEIDIPEFHGSFLSLVFDLPAAALAGLTRNHILNVCTNLHLQAPIGVFARLNICHGPNTEKLLCTLPAHEQNAIGDFDLAYADINEKKIDKAWVDLIFEAPRKNRVVVRDLTFSRRPRAGF